MSAKAVALISAAVLVVAVAVYLFVQVRGAPAQAGAGAPTVAREQEPSPSPPPPPPTRETMSRPAPPPASTDSRVRVGNDVASPQAMAAGSDDQRPNPKLESMMELANKAYDKQDYDDASAIAGKILAKDPTNVRMLRIMVSANCIQGDTAVAQQYYDKLPKFDREQMKARCDRYGVTFKEPSQ